MALEVSIALFLVACLLSSHRVAVVHADDCNIRSPSDDGWWSSTPSTSDSYNDDVYPDCNKRANGNPKYMDCIASGTCSIGSGAQGVFVLPFAGQCTSSMTARSNTSAFCWAASTDVRSCCNAALNNYAFFWQHFIPSGGCPACGRCYLYMSQAPRPACVNTAANGRLHGNVSTIGKVCPYGKHDPHFMGAQGTLFEFNGMPDKTFCLVTDRHLHVNMKMRGYLDTRTEGASIMKDGRAVRTWIRELGIVWDDVESGTNHTLRLVARDGKSMTRDNGFLKAIEYNGIELPLLQLGQVYRKRGGLSLSYSAAEKQGGFYDVDVYTLEIRDRLRLRIMLRAAHPLLQTPEDAEVHLNVHLSRLVHSEDVHGVLGQTYREGREKRALDYSSLSQLLGRSIAADGVIGKGFLDGQVEGYESSAVLTPDCLFSAYGGRTLPSVGRR